MLKLSFIVANFQALSNDNEKTIHALLGYGAEIDSKIKDIAEDSIYKEKITKEILTRVCAILQCKLYCIYIMKDINIKYIISIV